MKIKQYEIWIADLEPRRGTETGKVRPVVIVQTDFLNSLHPSIIICPITTNVEKASEILRVHLKKGSGNMQEPSDIMVDQIRAIDKRRLLNKVGELPSDIKRKLAENIKIVLELG